MSNASERAEQVDEEAIGPDVTVPGPPPMGGVPGAGSADDPEPTKQSREAGSLGDLTRDVSTSMVAEESGGMGSPLYDDEERQDK